MSMVVTSQRARNRPPHHAVGRDRTHHVLAGHETGLYERFDWSALNSYLVPGNNLLSIEVHQAAASSSDLSFDLS